MESCGQSSSSIVLKHKSVQSRRPKVLVIRFSSIGDIVLTTPILRCLSNQINAEIHYLVKSSFASVVEQNPYIHRLHIFQDSLRNTIESLSQVPFDYVIDLQNNLRSWRIKRALDLPSTSFNKENFAKWLMVNFKIDRLPDVHIVDRYMAAATKELTIQNDGKGLEVFFSRQPLNLPKGTFVALVIGAAHATKRLTTSQLIRLSSGGINYPLVLVGGPQDEQVARQIQEACPDVTNLVGQCDLKGSMQIIDSAALVISHDTGMMHIAAALKKPIISIWGNTIPSFGMYPYYPEGLDIPNAQFEVPNLSCRPCSKIGFDQCPKKHFNCMHLQDMEGIIRTANTFMVSEKE